MTRRSSFEYTTNFVVVSVRGSADGSKDPQQALQRVASEVVVGVLRELGSDAPRLIFVGGAGSLQVKPGMTYADTLGGMARAMMPAGIEQEIDGQVLALEYLRTAQRCALDLHKSGEKVRARNANRYLSRWWRRDAVRRKRKK